MPKPPAMRIKSHWFRADAGRSAQEQAGAMAFIVWRVAHNTLKRMRGADFDIDAGPAYFAFIRELLAFLIAVVDRMAYTRMDGAARHAFTTALVLQCADTLSGNETDLLGPCQGSQSYRDSFVDLVNELSEHYAEFGAEAEADPDAFMPDFAFVRYLGSRLEPTLPPKDRRWVLDQVMAVEAPEAVRIVRGAFLDLLSTDERKPRRMALSGD